jgi:DNA repair exonuclease SbcCD ATPase subunit
MRWVANSDQKICDRDDPASATRVDGAKADRRDRSRDVRSDIEELRPSKLHRVPPSLGASLGSRLASLLLLTQRLEETMNRTFLASVVVAGLTVAGCDTRPAIDSDRANAESAEKEAAEKKAAEQRERSEEVAELERRAANLESQWTEMQTKVKTRDRTATAGLREEVEEDVKNAGAAVADLKTTTAENWWERHERALERSISDVQADVQRLTRQKALPEPTETAEPVGTAGGFAGRRDAFVSRLRARVDALEEQLDKTKAKGALETELQDTKARIDKLQADLDELRSVSPDAWWDVSSERVGQYIDRVEASIKRLDDNEAQTDKPRS